MNKTLGKKYVILAILAIAIIVGFIFYPKSSQAPGELDSFARCLGDKGAKLYGAFWCSHCKSQKELFGDSAKYLPYIECSTPDGQQQLSVCAQAGIEGYPTWVFADGSRESGELSLKKLSEKTGCDISNNKTN